VNMFAGWTPDDGDRDRHVAWVRDYSDAMARHATGRYVNFLSDEGADGVRDTYGADPWRRLVAVKRRLDPSNLFRYNFNIDPGRTGQGGHRPGRHRVGAADPRSRVWRGRVRRHHDPPYPVGPAGAHGAVRRVRAPDRPAADATRHDLRGPLLRRARGPFPSAVPPAAAAPLPHPRPPAARDAGR